jgi:3-oxoacyl-[acyl-carrier-protein] synthase II
MNRRVVVTGCGVISPLGLSTADFWGNLVAGKSGVTRITRFDPTGYDTQIAAEVKGFDPALFMDRKEVRRNDLYVHYGLAATQEAWKDSGLRMEDLDPYRTGVVIGSGIGGIESFEEQHRTLLERGPSRVSPFFIPMMIANMVSGKVSILLGAKGTSYTTVSACASGAHAIGEAYREIQRGVADVMIAGGAEAAITPMSIAGFCSMKAMSVRNEEPSRASRPFDRERDGFVMGEGAGVVVLEEYGHAKARGARIRAEVIGYGSTSDAFHITAPAPDGGGAGEAMRLALAEQETPPSTVDYINAHGTSTPLNDRLETLAVKKVFAEHARRLAFGSTKSMTGHLLGAAGGLEFVACVLALENDIVPPTINYENPDPECDLDCVPNAARRMPVRVALSNSLGFGGHNVTLALRKVDRASAS